MQTTVQNHAFSIKNNIITHRQSIHSQLPIAFGELEDCRQSIINVQEPQTLDLTFTNRINKAKQ